MRNIAGMMAKYLATSLAMEKVVSDPRVMSSCLPTSTTSMSLVGFESRSTMLPASLAAWVPVFMARPTSAWARAGASLVPSPVIATLCPPRCSRLVEPLDHARLDRVLQVDDAQHQRPVGHDQGGAPAGCDPLDDGGQVGRDDAAELLDPPPHRVGRALTDPVSLEVDPAHAGLGREGDEFGLADGGPAEAVTGLAQIDDGAALGSLVRQARSEGRLGQLGFGDTSDRQDGCLLYTSD